MENYKKLSTCQRDRCRNFLKRVCLLVFGFAPAFALSHPTYSGKGGGEALNPTSTFKKCVLENVKAVNDSENGKVAKKAEKILIRCSEEFEYLAYPLAAEQVDAFRAHVIRDISMLLDPTKSKRKKEKAARIKKEKARSSDSSVKTESNNED